MSRRGAEMLGRGADVGAEMPGRGCRPVTAQTEDVVVVDGLLRPAEVVSFRDELAHLRAHHRAVPDRVCTLRTHEHTCLVNTSASIASRVRASLDAALRIRGASSTEAHEQKALPARITFGPVHAHRDSAWVRQRLPTNAPELGLDETDRAFSATNAYSVVVYLGGDGALVVGEGDSAREIEVVPGRLVAFPNHCLLHSAYGSMRQLLGPLAYIPGNHKNALWPTGNAGGPPECAGDSGLPCSWGDCEFFLSGRKLTRSGNCSGNYSNNELIIRAHGLRELDVNIFDGMTALEKIDLSGNNITTLPIDICRGLTSLEVLNMSDNILTTLPSRVFEQCRALRKIDLHRNAFSILPSDAFSGLDALRELWMHEQTAKGGGLTTLPSGLLDDHRNLTHFSLHSASVQTLPTAFFSNQSALRELYLHTNSITCLPSDIFRPLTGLTKLEIQGNPDLECGGSVPIPMLLYSSKHACACACFDCGRALSGVRASVRIRVMLFYKRETGCACSKYAHPHQSTRAGLKQGRPLTAPCILNVPCHSPIYSWGALAAASSWDGGGCAAGAAGRAAARAKLVWCRPSCTNDYDPSHSHKGPWDLDKNPMLIGVSGESAMPCMWDDCEFRLESKGNPPVQTLVRSGTCSDSWIVYDLGCPDGTKCGATKGNKCGSVASPLCNSGSNDHCKRWGDATATCGGGGPGLCSNGSPCSPTTEVGQQPDLTDPYGAQSV